MKTRFTLAAELELDEAIAFYEQRRRGLGRHFLKEVAHAVSLIEEFPEASPLISDMIELAALGASLTDLSISWTTARSSYSLSLISSGVSIIGATASAIDSIRFAPALPSSAR